MTQHALLSASGAHKWLRCTASARLEAEFPDTTSEFAREGTLAHSIAELKLRRYAIEPMSPATFTRRMNKLKKNPLYQKEMDGYTEEYLDYIKQIMLAYDIKPYIVAEKKVDFSQFVPEGFGTADCLIMTPDALHVVDFKYGKGVPVDAKDNPQLKLYALGALSEYGLLYQFKTIHIHIVQPRLKILGTDTFSRTALTEWGNSVVKPKAKEAFDGPGEFHPGDHCRFCRARAQCKARSEYYAALAETAKENANPALITMAELGEYLKKAGALKKWAEDLQAYALSSCLSGKTVPGWKAVEGRGSRVFTSTDEAFKVLTDNGIDESLLYSRVPATLAQTEKIIGKKVFETLLSKYVIKNPGKPTLAPESDKRKAISNVVSAKDIFKPVGGN